MTPSDSETARTGRARNPLRNRDVTRRTVQTRAFELEWVDDLEAVAADWRRLALRSRNLFATWEWASTWWRRFGGDAALLIGVCRRSSGECFALLPLYEWRSRPLRVLRLIGHDAADELGPVCAASDRALAARALRQALEELGADVLVGERLPGGVSWPSLLDGARVLKRDAYPLIRCAGGWAEYVATRSSHLRKKLPYQERKLQRTHDVRYRLASDADRLEADLDLLFALHGSRWQEATEYALYGAFHREFAAVAFEQGWLRLWFLELDGVPAAAWHGFRFAGVESHFQSGRDPRLAEASLGSVLLMHTIREALEDGADEYRFLRGGEAYKYRFATDDPGLETVALGRGAAGRLAVEGVTIARRLSRGRAFGRPGRDAVKGSAAAAATPPQLAS